MSDQDDNETQGVVFGVLAGVIFGVIALVAGVALWATNQSSAQPAAVAVAVEEEIVPVGDALVKVFFDVDVATLTAVDSDGVVVKTIEVLKLQPRAIVLLSGFHDPSGDAAHNAELARARAEAVRAALVAGGVPPEKVKLRKPESTQGSGAPEEARRVEVRVQ